MINPKDFSNPVGLFFPISEKEKENISKQILSESGAELIDENFPLRNFSAQFIGHLPNGNIIWWIK